MVKGRQVYQFRRCFARFINNTKAEQRLESRATENPKNSSTTPRNLLSKSEQRWGNFDTRRGKIQAHEF